MWRLGIIQRLQNTTRGMGCFSPNPFIGSPKKRVSSALEIKQENEIEKKQILNTGNA